MIRYLLLVLIAAVPLLAGCQTPIREKGNIIPVEALEQIKTGESTKEQVRTLLGTPSLVNSFRQERWIYIQDRRYKGDRAINRLEFTFDKDGVVRDIQRNFADQLLDPTKDPANVTPLAAGYWWTWEGKGKGSEPPAANDGRSIWERYFTRGQSTVVPPNAAFAPEEAGWWRGLWTEDPSRGSSRSSEGLREQPTEPPSSSGKTDRPWWKLW